MEFPPNPSVRDLSRARVFAEPLVPIGGEPSVAENAALTVALRTYAARTRPDDFDPLKQFLNAHPQSSWRAALLVNLGLDYYNTAFYSLALDAWREAWALSQNTTNAQGRFLADRAVCELAGLYSRLGRMVELEALLHSVENRVFLGGATERINLAREALSMMRHQPGISFRCGPLALRSIQLAQDPATPLHDLIRDAASTQEGFSLAQVEELSRKVGLNYQMAFRVPLSPSGAESAGGRGEFIVPSVLHWKVGHYAALVRQVGDRYLLEDPTFGNSVWATRQVLEAETSGYFLIPPGDLPPGWRAVESAEAATVWGKGVTTGNDPDIYTPDDPISCTAGGTGRGMAVSGVHLMLASLQISDTPIGYIPPVGPPVLFTVRYNHRDYLRPPSLLSSLFGPKWTHDWNTSIRDSPLNPLADVKLLAGGGGARNFTGFNPDTQTFAPQQYDLSRLRRTGPDRYELLHPDGSKHIFAQPDGSIGASRHVFLSQVIDHAGNAVTLTYDHLLRLVAITDAIGQVTTIEYTGGDTAFLIRRITDPFARSATFEYTFQGGPSGIWMLSRITDPVGITSDFYYHPASDLVRDLVTPYGTNTFLIGQGGGPNGTTRFVETHYPDGSRDRVEFNQSSTLGIPSNEPAAAVPAGMPVLNDFLQGRNTFYWSRTASASSHGDYTKARIYHWMHAPDNASTSGFLESTKEPLENRVWFARGGNPSFSTVTTPNRPTHIGRVLEDGQTQLHRFQYNAFGHVTNSVDPAGRTLSFIYASNAIDLLEVRQTRAGNNERLVTATYNHQHQPLTITDAAGQTTTLIYNPRGQLLTETNPRNETTTYHYDTNGYLRSIDGPLPGPNDTVHFTHDALGRLQSITATDGYTVAFAYDDLDRTTQVTFPDDTQTTLEYSRLDLIRVRDRAGRVTEMAYDALGQLIRQTDPLNRVTRFDWCRCGNLGSMTDPMGRTTSWFTDVQGRLTTKQYADGSRVNYIYEEASSRLGQVIDEKHQVTQFAYNLDDSLQSVSYGNSAVPTPGVSFTYDTNYHRITSMTDGVGTTRFAYHPIMGVPLLGAGTLASVDGPLPKDTITIRYDELGRPIATAINGLATSLTFDPLGRVSQETNALGSFTYDYDGATRRLLSTLMPGGQIAERSYGDVLADYSLQRITHRVGNTPLSEFTYGHDVPAGRIARWTQQGGTAPPSVFSFGYDDANRLLSVIVTNSGSTAQSFAYAYDPADNRLSETIDGTAHETTYNALNQLSTSTAPNAPRTHNWDALDRLTAVVSGPERTEFTYDGLSRLASIRKLVNGAEISHRRFVWCGGQICEERDLSGAVTKRYFPEGMTIETGAARGDFLYTRDHLNSVRDVTDADGNVRARFHYDPFGRPSELAGDIPVDFGFAGMFWTAEASLNLTHFRAYDPDLGRWLSRDPLQEGETEEGPNLYAYVQNDPINLSDPLGLISVAGLNWTDEEWARWYDLAGRGEVTEVFELREIKPGQRRAGGDLMLRPKGDLAVIPKLQLEPYTSRPRFRRPYPAPPLRVRVPAARVTRLAPAVRLPLATSVFKAGAGGFGPGGLTTVLEMTNCDTMEGILALVRQGKGGMANKHAHRMMKQIERYTR